MRDLLKFLSHAWEDDTRIWVRELATRLRFNGVETILDQWDVAPGDSLPEFMESSVGVSDFVLIICTPAYKRKSDSSDPSGVGYEKGVITGELFVKRNQRKFIPVLRKGRWLEAAPSWVLGKNHIDLRGKSYNEDSYQELLRTIYGKRKPPPALGTPPDFSDRDDGHEATAEDARETSKRETAGESYQDISAESVQEKLKRLLPNTSYMPTMVRDYLPILLFLISIVFLMFYLQKNISILTEALNSLIQALNPIPTEIADAQVVQMVLVPAGEFLMGSDADTAVAECEQFGIDCERDWFIREEPVHEVYLDDYYIDKYEVTNKFYAACVDAGVCSPPIQRWSFNRDDYYGNSQFDDYPVVFVNWDMAETYCEWRGAKLPTEAQWEKAARGTDQRIFPWGNDIDYKYANFDQFINDTTMVSQYEKGKSPYGVYDLAGNTVEWVYDWYSGTYYQISPSSNPMGPAPDQGDGRVVRGGSWFDDDEIRSAWRDGWEPFENADGLGFRCAKDATP